MDRRNFASDAEYYRAHGKAFRLAQQLGCTPREAETRLRRQDAAEARQRLAAQMSAPLPSCSINIAHDPVEPRRPWYEEN